MRILSNEEKMAIAELLLYPPIEREIKAAEMRAIAIPGQFEQLPIIHQVLSC